MAQIYNRKNCEGERGGVAPSPKNNKKKQQETRHNNKNTNKNTKSSKIGDLFESIFYPLT